MSNKSQHYPEWIERIAGGDNQALGLLYDDTVDRCYGVAMRIVREPADAEDVIAETFFQIWRDAGKYDQVRGSPLSWILTICRSRAIDLVRRRDKAHLDENTEQLVDAHYQHEEEPGDVLSALQDNSRLKTAMEKLADTPRQLLSLAFFRDLTHSEIAELTEMPLGTVKAHLRRAQLFLREELRNQELEP